MDKSKWNSIVRGLQSSGVTILSGGNKKSDKHINGSKEWSSKSGDSTDKESTIFQGKRSIRGVNEHKVTREFESRTCARKTAFPSKKTANWAKEQMAESGLHVYRCTVDPNHWHIGRRHGRWE